VSILGERAVVVLGTNSRTRRATARGAVPHGRTSRPRRRLDPRGSPPGSTGLERLAATFARRVQPRLTSACIAGAGSRPGHLHVCPALGLYTNFIPVLGDVKVIPEHHHGDAGKASPTPGRARCIPDRERAAIRFEPIRTHDNPAWELVNPIDGSFGWFHPGQNSGTRIGRGRGFRAAKFSAPHRFASLRPSP